MNINRQNRIRTIALASAGILCITLVAWNREPVYQNQDTINYNDTIPKPSREKTVHDNNGAKDFDEELRKLDEAKERLNEHSADHWDKVGNDLQQELSKINLDEIQLNARAAIDNIDLKKINLDIKNALASIDFDDIKIQLDKSLADLNINVDIKSEELRKALAEAKVEMKEGLKEANKVSNDEVKKALKEAGEEIRKAQIESSREVKKAMKEANEEIRKSLSEIRIDKSVMAESMEKAKEGIEKARIEVKGFQEMIYDMEEKGLLDTRENYKVKYADGKLTINGTEQSAEVTEKYSRYFGKDAKVIKKSGGKLSISSIE